MKKKNFLRKLSITVLASIILSSALSFTGSATLPDGDRPTPTPTPTPGLVNGFKFKAPYAVNNLPLTTIDEDGIGFLPPATYRCLLNFRVNDANNRHLTVTGGLGSMNHHVLFIPRTIDVAGLGAFTITEVDSAPYSFLYTDHIYISTETNLERDKFHSNNPDVRAITTYGNGGQSHDIFKAKK